jgi:hypothetical protein
MADITLVSSVGKPVEIIFEGRKYLGEVAAVPGETVSNGWFAFVLITTGLEDSSGK